MRILMVEDEKALSRAVIRYLGKICGFKIESYDRYAPVTPDKSIDVYFLDYNNPFGVSGGQWLEYFNKEISVHKRLLTSGDMDNWKHFTGVKIVKPYDLGDLERTLDLMYDNNKRFEK